MSTRGGFVRFTLLVTVTLFAILLLLTALQQADDLRPSDAPSGRAKEAEATPPPHQNLEEPIKEELVRQLEQELPELDYGFWYRWAKPMGYKKNATCAKYPDPLDLQLHNVYWQTFLSGNVTFRLYAAYLDQRAALKQRTIRVLATANQIASEFPLSYCQLWYENHKEPIFVNVSEYLSVWVKEWGSTPRLNYPHLLSCPVPKELPPSIVKSLPKTVSLVEQHCDKASNSLRVNQEVASRQDPLTPRISNSSTPLNFGVCVKGFDFPYLDLSERLIEWFELQRIMGATRIYAYMYDVHPAVQRVLDYYQHTGFLELRPLTLANGMPRLRHYQHLLLKHRLLEKRLNELIPYNDCFYRNLHRHDYLVNVDVDEVIMPKGNASNWHQLVQLAHQLEEEKGGQCSGRFPAICFRNSYFTQVPSELSDHEEQATAGELYVLQHTMRVRNYSLPGRATKCFHNSRLSLTLHNHFTILWLPGGCNPRTVDTPLAQMQHYREPDFKYNASDLIEDRNIWRFASQLRAAVQYVWLHLDDVLVQDSDPEDQEQQLDEALDQDSDSDQALQPPQPTHPVKAKA